ncbi:ABC transporter ATP-binding protein [Paenibacillus sp. SC116]|uniref:ABC transporter ATP-binding protein n=1 Tax=Paenibacillus sp. SC116 TaxID=2968986 RepID=UPI00215AA81C|nr:ABC transporter ATP-binding protein [Paenibacillus sp. SC116]MCR8842716.1 ABC transporter ATP-binding protein [Paenibacillus sp. SC116]
MIVARQVTKTFLNGKEPFHALHQLNIEIQKGEFVAIMGPSGAGKSTLLQLIGGLDLPTEGEVLIDDIAMHQLSEKDRTLFRRRNVGFVFQDYQLISTLTVEENVGLPLEADNVSRLEIKTRVLKLLALMGLENKAREFPNVLSGGQQQRVAIARALAANPRFLLADEPTGNLDRKRGTEILQLLTKLHKEERHTIIMVTHDILAAGYADRVIMIKDGSVHSDTTREEGDTDAILASFLAEYKR